MSESPDIEYTPTTAEVIQAIETGFFDRPEFGSMPMRREELLRWLEDERDSARLDGRIEERDAAREAQAAHDREVAAVERERCARIAEDATIGWNHDYDNGCADVARRIREGKQ